MTVANASNTKGVQMTRRLPKPPAHVFVLRTLTCIPTGCVTVGALVLAGLTLSFGAPSSGYVVFLVVVAGLAEFARRKPAVGFVALTPVVVAGSAFPIFAAPHPSRAVLVLASLPSAVVLATLLRRRPRRAAGARGSTD
jgi:hypothetical protein